MEESSEETPNPPPSPLPSSSSQGDYQLGKSGSSSVEAVPWIDYAVQQAQLTQKTIEGTLESAIAATRYRLDQIRSTSSAHFAQTIDSLQDLKSEYSLYEDAIFGKIKEGILIAASHPLVMGGVVIGIGSLSLKRPRRFLCYNMMCLFMSEEALLAGADGKVKNLQESIERLKIESEKLEGITSEDEMQRGWTKLKQAGSQIQSVIHSAYKIERQAGGLKCVLGELPNREAARFRSQVSKLASEAKRERNALTKEVTKISNHRISI